MVTPRICVEPMILKIRLTKSPPAQLACCVCLHLARGGQANKVQCFRYLVGATAVVA